MTTATRSHDLAATLNAGAHTFVSGLSPKNGGADEGPNPHELLEASLAACTSLTCQMYANRKGWNLKSATVTVHVANEGREGSKIERDITFLGDLSPEERDRLLEIANKCPVHILLESTVTVETRLRP